MVLRKLIGLVLLLPLACKMRSLNSDILETKNLDIPSSVYPRLTVRPRAVIEVPFPAFLSLKQENHSSACNAPAWSLLISRFGKDSKIDGISRLPDLCAQLRQAQDHSIPRIKTEVMTAHQMVWPNEVAFAPPDMLGEDVQVVAGGFLVPFRHGHISLLRGANTGSPEIHRISEQPLFQAPKWFYHRVTFKDVDGDGDLDIVAPRALRPLVSLPFALPGFPNAPEGELVAFLNPTRENGAQAAWTQRWKEKILIPRPGGPDVHITEKDIDSDGRSELVAPIFFGRRLSLFRENGDRWKETVIDSTLGEAFDAAFADLNGDGMDELLVTNHVPTREANVFAYAIPDRSNLENPAQWRRRSLIPNGIPTTKEGKHQASPGTAMAFNIGSAHRKPLILVSGDGSERLHLLTPQSNDAADWSYHESFPLEEAFAGRTADDVRPEAIDAVVGKSAMADVDGDGDLEIFVPLYDASRIFVFSLGEPH